MKNFIEIVKEVEEIDSAIRTLQAEKLDQVRAYAKRNPETYERKKDMEVTRELLIHNAKVALFNEVMPVICKILAKYSGKPYGEKTRQKIRDEIKATTNTHFYIDSRYSACSYEVIPVDGFGNHFNISCSARYIDGEQKPLLIGNKIQPITFDELQLYMPAIYIADIPQRVQELKAIYAEAIEKQEELKAICSRYNSLAFGRLKHIYCSELRS